MELLGGEVRYVPQEAGMQGALDLAQELAADIKNSFIPQQFENPANPCFHEKTTGREIIEQMQGRIDAVVIGAGTAGTFTGVARAVRKVNPRAFCVLVEPQGSIYGGGPRGCHKVEGIGQYQFIPGNFDSGLADEIMMIMDDEAFATVRRLAETEGVLGGGSTGAAAAAAYRVAERLGKDKRIVTVFPDGAERYMSQGIFD
jgi:cysteine synthase